MSINQTDLIEYLRDTYPFRKMTIDELEQMTGILKVIEITRGEVLHALNDPADHLYLIYSGHIELSRLSGNNQMEVFGVVDPGEIFGLESIVSSQAYHTRMVARSSAVLIAIHQDDLQVMMNLNNEVRDFLHILMDSYFALLGMRLSWRQDDEMIFWSSRKHPVFLWLRLLIPVFFGILLTGAYLIFLVGNVIDWFSLSIIFGFLMVAVIFPCIYILVDWRNDFFMITDRRVISRDNVVMLYETKEETSLDAIQSVNKVISHILAATIGYGDITIRTYTGSMVFDKIPNPDIIADFIEDIRLRRRKSRAILDQSEKVQEMRQKLGYASPIEKQPAATGPKEDSTVMLDEGGAFSGMRQVFRALFSLRTVDGDEVTYRTHWLMLLKRTFLPLTIFFAGVVFFIVIGVRFAFLELNIPPLLIDLGVLFVTVMSAPVIVYQYFDWRDNRYILSNRQVVDLHKKPFGREDRRAAPLNTIQSVEYKRLGVFGILFNYGTVYIRVGDTLFNFDYVANPAGVQQEITHRIEATKERERLAEVKRERETILDWIEVYHNVQQMKANQDQNDFNRWLVS